MIVNVVVDNTKISILLENDILSLSAMKKQKVEAIGQVLVTACDETEFSWDLHRCIIRNPSTRV